jgi:uncharacterized repeat protein (TIGR03803 family)
VQVLSFLVIVTALAGWAPAPAAAAPSRRATAFVSREPRLTVKETVLYRFKGGSDGASPEADLIETGGAFYGTTVSGGTKSQGTVFGLTPAGKEHVIYRFKGAPDGSRPQAGLLAYGGALYGTTLSGGDDQGGGLGVGTVFDVTFAGKETTLYAFKSIDRDANSPWASLIVDGGELYGTTQHGGADFGGTVFAFAADKERISYSFHTDEALLKGTDGAGPRGKLVAVGGEFYGTTLFGGPSGFGTVFKTSTAGKESVLYSFHGGADGGYPHAGLVALGSALYGTTAAGGKYNAGTVFEISATGKERVVYNFTDGADGAAPYGDLIAVDGALYGTTTSGGLTGTGGAEFGTVFEITPAGKEVTLYAFKSGTDGASPFAGLLYYGGSFYGTTLAGGSGFGTVFKLTL